ncbi:MULTISPECIES: hypothetical protein [unclassified Microcoleus]|uniref:hypothetical protein n=1 Tax=unclassified Microcoleus TaxID=2642155 RepID=UPI001D94C84B|nr:MULTISPECIES: hypothetical protein [unclassified Microcoleus]MCC3466348.1 hypothetical protein [Microcoleus sp. PH2017_06_SFM_O_A]MCC3499863.1 hypothetical protein [Microcoleus sp. PH2017_15_JOR_U_A]MCC3503757.1 hypothetical protein [Microcoleus sp. PH2017_19_SFW_U_A]MCC3580458.1 hypothetical protein [Microcoleus sp. PH2017_32_RDM_D_A]MCC3587796.1 hypothetical protein [Microcoleus sp. PH2017_30_WIL_O_A]
MNRLLLISTPNPEAFNQFFLVTKQKVINLLSGCGQFHISISQSEEGRKWE